MALGLEPGTQYAGYTIVRELGRGGFGLVYLAKDNAGGLLALKILNALHSELSIAKHLLTKEVRVADRVRRPQIVEVLASGVQGGDPWIAMEFIHGRTLERYLATQGATIAVAADLLAQICAGVGAAHGVGIAHCDLKPENIMVQTDNGAAPVVKILDFGLARLAGKSTTRFTRQQGGMGTVAFMAPEQFHDDVRPNARADVWAIGLVAFYVLAGRSYWKSTSSHALMREALTPPYEPPTARAAGTCFPDGFDQWFGRCVLHDRDQRFTNAAEAGQALGALFAGVADRDRNLPRPVLPADPLADTEAPVDSRGGTLPQSPVAAEPAAGSGEGAALPQSSVAAVPDGGSEEGASGRMNTGRRPASRGGLPPPTDGPPPGAGASKATSLPRNVLAAAAALILTSAFALRNRGNEVTHVPGPTPSSTVQPAPTERRPHAQIPSVPSSPLIAPEPSASSRQTEPPLCCRGLDCESNRIRCPSGWKRVPCADDLARHDRKWTLRIGGIGETAPDGREQTLVVGSDEILEVCVRAGGGKAACVTSDDGPEGVNARFKTQYTSAELGTYAFVVSVRARRRSRSGWASLGTDRRRFVTITPEVVCSGLKMEAFPKGGRIRTVSIFLLDGDG